MDDIWYGRPDNKGPLTYTDRQVAKLAAAIVAERLEDFTRVVAKEIDPKTLRFKDQITPALSCDEAIERLDRRIKKE